MVDEIHNGVNITLGRQIIDTFGFLLLGCYHFSLLELKNLLQQQVFNFPGGGLNTNTLDHECSMYFANHKNNLSAVIQNKLDGVRRHYFAFAGRLLTPNFPAEAPELYERYRKIY